jgi:DNA-binding NarL/FixJ family response regulator
MTPIDRPRVLLVDDNEAILKRVTATLSRVYEIVSAVRDGAAALDAVRQLRPDVVVLDISMPGMSGLDVARHLDRAESPVRVVFLTMHNEPELVETAQAAGGIGYVHKPRLSSDLTIAIDEALEGRRYVSTL